VGALSCWPHKAADYPRPVVAPGVPAERGIAGNELLVT
jgi:hypothetical protein